MSMRTIMVGVVAALTFWPGLVFAQGEGMPKAAVDFSNTQVQEAVKKALADLKPGATVVDHVVSLADMGKYTTAVAVVVRPAGTNLSAYLVHDKIAEIYYVLKGSGTQVTGTMTDGKASATPSKTIGPGSSGTAPLKNPHTTVLKPGDIQIVPPGVGHGFTSIDPGGIQYLVFRIDPEKVLGIQ
jgi:mannose-6-phosphate isomerase-like protein (cupin superfamily)